MLDEMLIGDLISITESYIDLKWPGIEKNFKSGSHDGATFSLIFSWRPTKNGVKQDYIYLNINFSREFIADYRPHHFEAVLDNLRRKLNMDLSESYVVKMLTESLTFHSY